MAKVEVLVNKTDDAVLEKWFKKEGDVYVPKFPEWKLYPKGVKLTAPQLLERKMFSEVKKELMDAGYTAKGVVYVQPKRRVVKEIPEALKPYMLIKASPDKTLVMKEEASIITKTIEVLDIPADKTLEIILTDDVMEAISNKNIGKAYFVINGYLLTFKK